MSAYSVDIYWKHGLLTIKYIVSSKVFLFRKINLCRRAICMRKYGI